MKKPRELRVHMKLPVRIWGMDSAGKLFNTDAHTIDITPVGACIQGASASLERGSIIGVQCGRSQARFRIVWIGQRGSKRQGQIGIRCVDLGKYIWGISLERTMEEISISEAKAGGLNGSTDPSSGKREVPPDSVV
jgi:hypothetical protein